MLYYFAYTMNAAGDDAQKKVAGKVWCEIGEHAVVRDYHWVTVYPGFPDCFECCKENEFLEATGMERNETGDIIDTDGQVFLTAAGYAAAGYVTGDYAEYHQRTGVFEKAPNWYKDTKKEDAEKKVAGTFTLYSLSLSRNVLDSKDSVLNSVCCVLCRYLLCRCCWAALIHCCRRESGARCVALRWYYVRT